MEKGTHQQLLVMDGLYAHLCQLQQERREREIALETVADAIQVCFPAAEYAEVIFGMCVGAALAANSVSLWKADVRG